MKILMLLMTLVDSSAVAADRQPDVQLLDFTASYCAPCQMMLPRLLRMEQDGFPIRKIDITEEHELAQRFKVDQVPTLVLMVEGREVQRFNGLTDEAELRSCMNRAARTLAESRGAVGERQPVAEKSGATPAAERPAAADEGLSIKGIFTGLLGAGGKSAAFEHPSVRGQSPDVPVTTVTGLAAAEAATVRVKVLGKSSKDGATLQDVGTGTIVYSASGQAIVLTCAHVFLDIIMADAVIDVEVFHDGTSTRYPAKVVGGDHNADVAFLKLQTSKLLPHVRLTSLAPALTAKQNLTSFGCNGGADPTRLETQLVDINRYDGPANLVCTIDPVSGRSGGGLFNSAGELIGVCSCADRKRAEGLYMAHAAVMGLVSRLKLGSILLAAPVGSGEDAAEVFAEMSNPSTVIDGVGAPGSGAAPPVELTESGIAPMELNDGERRSADQAATTPEVAASTGTSGPDTRVAVAGDQDGALSDAPLFVPERKQPSGAAASVATAAVRGPEVRILINDKTPGSEPRVIVIPQASPWLLELLTGESADGTPVATAALRPIQPGSDVSSEVLRRSAGSTTPAVLAP